MAALLLDDIGLSLLADVWEARESASVHRSAPTATTPVAEFGPFQRERDRRESAYIAAIRVYVRHLEFIRDTPEYESQLTHILADPPVGQQTWNVMALVLQYKYTPDDSDMIWIAETSLEFYGRLIGRVWPPPRTE